MSFEMSAFGLKGRTTLVIGGTGGIGRAIALGYRAAGARSLVAARDRTKLDATAEALGGGGVAYAADATAPDDLDRLAERVEADHGPLDVLVNCQGTIAIKPMLEHDEADYDRILDTNLKSVFFACQAFGRRMTARGRGSIVNVTSLAAHTGWAGAAAYGVSKWGVASLTETLAAEWGEAGVRVNAIAPGFFLTDLNRERMPEARKEEARLNAAMRRMGEVDELVGAAVYLASDAARFVTGATLRVDGGYGASGI
ncbi:MAG: SDR family NAD(P)-dependent oxidoreductase [Paracoccaceae bacterium]